MNEILIKAVFKMNFPSNHKFVFIALCIDATKLGVIFPKTPDLCRMTGLSARLVKRSVRHLFDCGFIENLNGKTKISQTFLDVMEVTL